MAKLNLESLQKFYESEENALGICVNCKGIKRKFTSHKGKFYWRIIFPNTPMGKIILCEHDWRKLE